MILENVKKKNRFAVENFPTFPVDWQLFQVLVECEAMTKACDLIHAICLCPRQSFFGNPRAVIGLSQIPYQGILHSLNESATGGEHLCRRVQGDLL